MVEGVQQGPVLVGTFFTSFCAFFICARPWQCPIYLPSLWQHHDWSLTPKVFCVDHFILFDSDPDPEAVHQRHVLFWCCLLPGAALLNVFPLVVSMSFSKEI